MSKKVPLKLAKGRKITIPKNICEKLGVEEGDFVMLEVSSDSAVMRALNEYEVKK